MSEMGDDFRAMREERNERKRKRKKSNTELVMTYQGDIDYDFEVEVVAPYQLRLTGNDGRKFDYFPTSGKGTWVGSNDFFKVPDIERFIAEHYKSK